MERHELLEAAIGTYPEEKDAYWIATLLSWLLPSVVLIGSLVDVAFVIIYMMVAHPWIGILKEKKEEKKDDAESIVDGILDEIFNTVVKGQ